MPRLILCLCLIAVPLSPASAQDIATVRAEVDRLTAAREWTSLLDVLARLRTMAASTGDWTTEAEALRRAGLTYQQLKSYEQARHAFEAALAIVVAAGNRGASGQLRDDLGLLAWTLGDQAGIRAHRAAAAEDYAAAGLPNRQAYSLRNLAFSTALTLDERLEILDRALAIKQEPEDPRLRGLLQHHRGDVLNARGDLDRGYEALEIAVALLENHPRELALALTSVGRAFRLHGLPERAIATYHRALPLLERLGDQPGIAQLHDALGISYSEANRSREALASFEKGIEIARREGLTTRVPYYLVNYASQLEQAGEYGRALEALRPLLSGARPDALEENFQQLLAQIYLGLGQLDDAMRAANTAIGRYPSATSDFYVQSLLTRARIRRERGDRDGAIADALRSLEQLEGVRAKSAARDAMKQAFVDRHRRLFDFTIPLQREAGDAAGAFETAERARARAFQDLLASRNLRPLGERPTAAIELPSAIATSGARFADVRAAVAAVDSTLVTYWVGPEETVIFALSANGTLTSRSVRVRPDRFDALVQQIWRTSDPASTAAASDTRLTARSGSRLTLGGNPRAALRELYDLLIKPIETELPTTDGSLLTIVPHGPLFGVPFAALIDARQNYLLETYRLHYLPSAALLQASMTAAPASAGLLLVADPSPMPAAGTTSLAALPGARAEVGDILALVPKGSATALVGAQAIESSVRTLSAGKRAIHLATHGLVFDDRPFESFLALAPGRSGDDGRLTTSDIYGLRLNADLVVLSGCRTATGQVSGDGVHGLARAFFYAGTPAVVASLWDLPDRPARHLFPQFYKSWMGGASRSAALRDAQLSLIRALRRGSITVDTPLGSVNLPEHPAIWAAPVLLGQP